MAITLLFSTTNSWISRAIRFVLHSKVSHVAVGVEVFGVPVVIDPAIGGVKMHPRKAWNASNRVVAEYKIKPYVHNGLAHAIEHLGEKYDYVGLVGFLVVLFWRWLGKKARNPLASPSAVVCSEFVLHLDHEHTAIPEWKGLDPEATTPKDLLRICEAGGSFKFLPSKD